MRNTKRRSGRAGAERHLVEAMLFLALSAGAACSRVPEPHDETRSHYQAAQLARFVVLDTDRDGRLAPAEMDRGGPMVPTYDRNRDGIVSQPEFLAGRLASFDRADRNHDNTVTSSEIAANRADRNRWERSAMPSN